MPYQDFRQFLDVLRQHGELIDINRPIELCDVGKTMKQSYRRHVVNRQWAAQRERGKRLSRAIVQSHGWLLDPGNRNEAIAILQKYTKRDTAVMDAVYDLFIAKDRLYTADAAVDTVGVDTEIATMIEKGILPPGTTISPRDYMLPRELGGLYR
jgi:hypothetical protein